MTYRDDLAAAQTQNEDLRRELDEARRRIEELEAEKAVVAHLRSDEPTALATSPPSMRPPRVLAGRVYYDPPRTYLPLLDLFLVAVGSAWRHRPATTAPDSDSFVLVLGYHAIWRPFVYAVWLPVYVVTLALFVVPWAAIVAAAASVLLLPVIVLARLRIGDVPAVTGEGWPQGDTGEDVAAMLLWSLLAVTMPPLLPVFIPLLTVAEKIGSRPD